MKRALYILVSMALVMILCTSSFADLKKRKDHDFLPRVHNIIFIMDVSDSMMAGHPKNFDLTRLFIAARAMLQFNRVMPHVPEWQYDLNSALITFGDCKVPQLREALAPWTRVKYDPFYPRMRVTKLLPKRTAGFQEALQLAGSLMTRASGRTAIVVFTDGGSMGECPQKTATALKKRFGGMFEVYGIWLGAVEAGWRNLYEVCKLTGGYCRAWEDVRHGEDMQKFAWDITGREIMFPYTEVFFQHKKADLLPSEALKLEAVANFMHAIPQYLLQIDGHTDFFGDEKSNYELAKARAR
ncbi:VWA domain-containing protein, partial [Thermodesulfobacteriota bacterium]